MNILVKTFKEFIKDYKDFYGVTLVRVSDELDMQEVCYDLYDTDSFEINYRYKTIELFL